VPGRPKGLQRIPDSHFQHSRARMLELATL